ncbi:MAG: hypothetical protein IH987_08785 [Planctomycetes bacterium]|nr:hypothetical protein [Planctomycetota bacterium]
MLRRQFPQVGCSLTILAATIATHSAPCFAAAVFQDNFDNGVVDSRYTPIGSATLAESGGRMRVGTVSPGDGIRIDLSDLSNTVCHMIDFSVEDSTVGDAFLWKWIVRDDENNVYPILEFEASETSPQSRQLGMRTTKKDKDGNEVTVVQSAVIYVNEDNYRIKWDRRTITLEDGTKKEQVQLELINKSTGEYYLIFPWQDPPPTQTVAFEMTTNFDMITFDGVVVESEHVVPAVSEWGLIVMTVLGLTAGTIFYGRRRRCASA